MTDRVYLVGSRASFGPLRRVGQVLRSREEVGRALGEARKGKWILKHARSVDLFSRLSSRDTFHRLLVLEPLSVPRRALLAAFFRSVLAPGEGITLLSPEELAEVMESDNPRELFIGGTVDIEDGRLVLFRGNLETLVVPLAWFRASKSRPRPDPSRLRIDDSGQTVCLGDYEAAADAILYEFDARRRMKARERASEDSLGASIRRLRLQRGLGQGDFDEISAKTISRIESGTSERPHESTLESIAARLDVAREEVEKLLIQRVLTTMHYFIEKADVIALKSANAPISA
jgi:hypothetical protein